MKMSSKIKKWGLHADAEGKLLIGGLRAEDLAIQYGTPLHVVHEERLQESATKFLNAVQTTYPGTTSVHFAFKCNPVAGVIRTFKETGLHAEIMSESELKLALKLGYQGQEIVVNGPQKTDIFLISCLQAKVRFIQVDSLTELDRLESLCLKLDTQTDILLRINPDFTPSGMNKGSATASRKGSPFGLDLKGGEVEQALAKLSYMQRLNFKGFHIHIGSGIQNTNDYRRVLLKLKPMVDRTTREGFRVDVMNVGGGLGVPDSREMTAMEMLTYQAFDYLKPSIPHNNNLSYEHFAKSVTAGMLELFKGKQLPELLFEPGRCIASCNQLLLLNVHQVKKREVKKRGQLKTWLITDGGIGTTTMPTFYERHTVILCNEVDRQPLSFVTLSGPGCFAADSIYRKIQMPEIEPGETIAIMDSGAYFTSWESNFGYPRPAVLSVRNGRSKLLRNRETFEQMISQDVI